MLRRLSLRTKLTVTVLAVFITAMAALTWIALSQGTGAVSASAQREASNLATGKAAVIETVVERTRAQAVQVGAVARSYAGTDRTVVDDGLRETLRDSPELFGVWLVYLPGRAPGADPDYVGTRFGDHEGVYSPYWNREGGKVVDSPSDDVRGEYKEDYFTAPIRAGRAVVVEPYVDPVVKRLMTSVSVPVVRDGTTLGVAGVDVSLDQLRQDVSSVRVFGDGHAMLVSADGVMLAAPDKAMVGKTKLTAVPGLDAAASGRLLKVGASGEAATVRARDPFTGRDSEMFAVPVAGSGWTYILSVPREEMLAPISALRRTLLLAGLIGSPLVAAIVLLVIARLTKPLAEVQGAAARIARGDLTVDVPVRSQDEIGALAQTFNGMTAYLRETADVAERVAAGDLTASPRVRSERDTLGQSLTRMTTSLRELVRQVVDASAAVSTSGHRVAEGASAARLAADQMAVTVERVASGATEQSARIGESTMAVEGAQVAVDSAGTAAQQGIARSDDTRGAMREISAASDDVRAAIEALEETSRQVVGITDEVDGIADQTQLLALNARIEAARAGQHGAGFAVVAGEVADLASRAQTAASSIRTLVEGTRTQVGEAVRIVEEGRRRTDAGVEVLERAREAFGDIQTGVETVQLRIAEIRAASDTVTAVAREASATSGDAADAASRVTQATHDIDSSAAQLAAEADRLASSVERFRL